MDTVSSSDRSRIMAKIRSSDNKSTEVAVAAFFRIMHVTGWRRRYPLLGKPDFVFPKSRKAVFVDGCFWHGCPRHCRIPKSNTSFWIKKIETTKKRDKKNRTLLRERGWIIIRIWEHELSTFFSSGVLSPSLIKAYSSLSSNDSGSASTKARISSRTRR